jgi:uncharacterized membrane protein
MLAESRPPNLPAADAPRAWRARYFAPVWVVLTFIVLAFTAQFAARWNVPLPQCIFRKLTGLPCMSCGCTRSLTAWSHLDFAAAFRFNPLFFLVCTGLLAWLGIWLAEHFSGRRFLDTAQSRLRRWPLWRILIALVLANWLYLCLALPR